MRRIIVAGEKGSHFAAMFDSELNKQKLPRDVEFNEQDILL